MTTISIADVSVPCEFVRKKRSKSITISVRTDGVVVVSRPWWVRQVEAEHFLYSRIAWIQDRLDALEAIPLDIRRQDAEHYVAHKERARELVAEKVSYWAERVGVTYGRISIRRQKTRWGSCSSAGNLNFNYKIIFLDPELQDYLVIHELCHRKQMNHSQDFWDEVGKYYQDYKNADKKLRKLALGYE